MKMKIYYILGIIVYSFNLIAYDIPKEKIERELTKAEKDFQIAKNMFNPWYGGPLLTGSGNVIPSGYVNFNPQIQVTDYYAVYDSSGNSVSIPNITEVNPVFCFGVGLFNGVDMNLELGWDYQEQLEVSYFGWQDVNVKFSFAILKEQPHVPAMKISIKEIFPTGKYKNLNPEKIEIQGLGDGSYKTEFGLGLSKIVWWWLTHPMQFRLSLNYGVASKVKVKNFNTYGGGYGTDGKVKYGNYFKSNVAYEFSISQKIVLAIDFAYEYYAKKSFKGIKGVYKNKTEAVVGSPFGDKLSLAPAIEYNFTSDISLIAGIWFTVWGRNKLDFIAGIISFTYGF